jgi:uncharacterized protein YmfQ (DUF2313 family)
MTHISDHTIQEHANSLALYMPSGKLFQAARQSTTNFRKFIEGLADELKISEGFLKSYQDEYDVRTTSLLIEQWESALGIPDDCFSGDGTLVERRRDALAKLGSLGVQTAEDFEAVALIFGIDADVQSGVGVATFPFVFPIPLLLGDLQSKFTIVVFYSIVGAESFTFTFPFILGDSRADVLRCLFEKLKPANCEIFFNEVAP